MALFVHGEGQAAVTKMPSPDEFRRRECPYRRRGLHATTATMNTAPTKDAAMKRKHVYLTDDLSQARAAVTALGGHTAWVKDWKGDITPALAALTAALA